MVWPCRCNVLQHGEYHQWNQSNIPAKCGYQEATCHLAYLGYDTTASCWVRRKGSRSWRSMGDKPSLKMKLDKSWRGMKKLSVPLINAARHGAVV